MKTPLRGRINRWAIAHSDRLPNFNPTLFLLLLALGVFVFPTAIGVQELPGSLGSADPTVLAQGSSALVVLGCFTADLGMVWRSRDTGLALEAAGKFVLGVGLAVYAGALYQYQSVSNRAYVFSMSLGLAVGCFVRAVQILLYVRGRVLRSKKERHGGQQ